MNRSFDHWLVLITAVLLAFGLVMVFSASAVLAEEEFHDPYKYLIRQSIAIVVGVGVAAAMAFTPTRALKRFGYVAYAACLAGLLCTYVPGLQYKANGAARWIGMGGVNVQPSEFAKIAVLIVLSSFLDQYRTHLHDRRVLAAALAIPALPAALTLGQPDFGTTAIMVGLCGIMLVIAGLQWRYLIPVAGAGALGVVFLVTGEEYRWKRVTSFMDPWQNQQGDGYHIIQSWVAMHSGGVNGQGLGNSMAKLHFLPEPWTDFIGAVIGEELGLVGLVGLVSLFALFVWRGMRIAQRASTAFGTYLAATLAVMIGLEAFFNLAVILGLVPPKGLVLPFISYGSSATLANLWAVGVLLSIAAEAKDQPLAQGWQGAASPLQAQAAR